MRTHTKIQHPSEMTEPLCFHGELQPSRTDDFFRACVDQLSWSQTGDTDWFVHATLAQVTPQDVIDYVSEFGDPWMSEQRNFEPRGWFVITFDGDGNVRAYRYQDHAHASVDYVKIQDRYVRETPLDSDPTDSESEIG